MLDISNSLCSRPSPRSFARPKHRRAGIGGCRSSSICSPMVGLDFGRVFLGRVNLNNTARIAANFAATERHHSGWVGSAPRRLRSIATRLLIVGRRDRPSTASSSQSDPKNFGGESNSQNQPFPGWNRPSARWPTSRSTATSAFLTPIISNILGNTVTDLGIVRLPDPVRVSSPLVFRPVVAGSPPAPRSTFSPGVRRAGSLATPPARDVHRRVVPGSPTSYAVGPERRLPSSTRTNWAGQQTRHR